MNQVVEEADINIEFAAKVVGLTGDGTPCASLADGSTLCARRRIFVGTGLRKRDERYLWAIRGIR